MNTEKNQKHEIPTEARISPSGIATRYSVSAPSVYNYIKEGKIPAERERKGEKEVYFADVLQVDAFFESALAATNRVASQEIAIADIKIDMEMICRAGLDEETLGQYSQEMKEGALKAFPPAIVYKDPTTGQLLLAEGLHRIEAAKRAGIEKYHCFVREGGKATALMCCLQANETNALKRRKGDKTKAVKLALSQFTGKSAREIGRLCRVSHTFVNNIIQDGNSGQGGSNAQPRKQILNKARERFSLPKSVTSQESAKQALELISQKIDQENYLQAAICLRFVAAAVDRLAKTPNPTVENAA